MTSTAVLVALVFPALAVADDGSDMLDLDAIVADVEDELSREEPSSSDDEGEDEDEEPGLELPVFGRTTLSLTSTTLTDLRRSPVTDDGFAWTATERLGVAAQGDELRAAVRLDGFVPIVTPSCARATDALCALAPDLRPERVTLAWERDEFTLELGDSHVVVGRGIALTMRKEDALGVDTALRGLRVERQGDVFFGTVFAGVANPQNLDAVGLVIDGDPLDVLAGVEGGIRFGDTLEVGLHALRVWFLEDRASELGVGAGEQDVTADVAGWHLAMPDIGDGALALYLEANAMRRVDSERDERSWGRAVYGSAQVTDGDWTLLLEWKDYRDFVLAPRNETDPARIYSAPPSLDRPTERTRAVENSRGGSVQVGFAPEGDVSVAATGVVYGLSEDPAIDPWDGILVGHGFVTVDRRDQGRDDDAVGWSLQVVGGYRRESHLESPVADPTLGQGALDWRVVHVEADAAVSSGEHGFEVRVEQRFERRLLRDYVDYVRGAVTLTWSFGDRLTVSPTLQWSTEKQSLPTLYPGGEVKLQVGSGSFVRLFGGRSPGGRLCSGGVCRDVPAFDGGQLEVVLRL